MTIKNKKKVTPTQKKKEVSSSTISITHEGDSMRGLFFIVKGHYSKAEPSFVNKVSGDVSYIGGYDPYNENTKEWYMLMDKMTFHCVSCGGDFNKVLKALHNIIMKHKGSAKKYFKYVSSITSDDYYETHYLGHTPLNYDQRVQKAEGRCPRVSPVMQELYKHIYNEYGDHYLDSIGEIEDLAYHDLEKWNKENNSVHKNRKRMARVRVPKLEMETPKKKEVITSKKMVKPKPRLGVKKLKLG